MLRMCRNISLSFDEAFQEFKFVNCCFKNLTLIDYDFGEAKLEKCTFNTCLLHGITQKMTNEFIEYLEKQTLAMYLNDNLNK